MHTRISVGIMVHEPYIALKDAACAADQGADMIEWRIDPFLAESEPDLIENRIDDIRRLIKNAPLPCIVTCRTKAEGGLYRGSLDDLAYLLNALLTTDDPQERADFIDIEYQALDNSPKIAQLMSLFASSDASPENQHTRLILSMHDFAGRPADLSRKILAMRQIEAASVIKVAYTARSIRDNLEIFDLLQESDRPMIALAMGEFGLMSRVLAPKFNAFATFACLEASTPTAPGQPTITDLLDLYHFRDIDRQTQCFGIVGWPVSQSLSPLVHNAGFNADNINSVYLPMPALAHDSDDKTTFASFKATICSLMDCSALGFAGASVTLPFKEHLFELASQLDWAIDEPSQHAQAANTIACTESGICVFNTDASAAVDPLQAELGELQNRDIAIVGAGGVARSIAAELCTRHANVHIYNRNPDRAQTLAQTLGSFGNGSITANSIDDLPEACADAFVNCTPVGMAGSEHADELSIPIPDMKDLRTGVVFLDTVYNPVNTPMLKAATGNHFTTIDGITMFVAQAHAQFKLWTGQAPPVDLFDGLCRANQPG